MQVQTPVDGAAEATTPAVANRVHSILVRYGAGSYTARAAGKTASSSISAQLAVEALARKIDIDPQSIVFVSATAGRLGDAAEYQVKQPGAEAL
ncbi:hypothetical protein [Pseudomonas sp. Marseille-Q5115]|uniref:hypothetical protein n=1 Tax=Pseudomonas sp. Marseille-Q5115 TaxID=2866593 RepID=UPI001CE47E23|nr:hypothetical protein [Pseudomonas sp. Marseille-Q5115]